MNRKTLFALWGCLFILCAGLGLIPEPASALRVLMTLVSLVFFLPPALLLYRAGKERDTGTLLLIRSLSALSLGLTLVLLIVNFLTAFRAEVLGGIVYYILAVVSSPMICCGHWALSLFLWACLLMVSLSAGKKAKS